MSLHDRKRLEQHIADGEANLENIGSLSPEHYESRILDIGLHIKDSDYSRAYGEISVLAAYLLAEYKSLRPYAIVAPEVTTRTNEQSFWHSEAQGHGGDSQ